MSVLHLAPSSAPAVIDAASGRSLSFADLIERAEQLVDPLGGARSLLFLLARNDLFSVLAYAGALRRGHPVAMLDAQSAPTQTAALIDAYRPPWVAGPLGTSAALAAAGVAVRAVQPVEDGELIRTDHRPVAISDELAVLLATSGTTGSRKFVRLSGRNVESNALSICQYLGLGPEERPITSLPLHYSFGLSVLNSHWLAGAPVVLTDLSVVQQEFWETFTAGDCTSLAGVPFTFALLERVGFRSMSLPTLRTIQQAGGALDRRLTERYASHMAERGGRLFVMYGQTEATARIAYVPPGRLLEKLGSAGIAVPGGRLRIEPAAESGGHADDSGESPTAGGPQASGEVVYEGPNVMLGYATGAADLSREDDLEGVLHTGDLGYLDDDGFLFLVGRSKRIAKVHGLRVNLDEVEVLLREAGPAAVVGGPDSIWGFCAFGSPESLTALARSLTTRLRLHHSVIQLRQVASIPTSTSGKVDYGQLETWIPTGGPLPATEAADPAARDLP